MIGASAAGSPALDALLGAPAAASPPRRSSLVALLGVSAAVVVAAALPAPARAAGPVTPAVLDTIDPVGVDVRGSTIAWLRPLSKASKTGAVQRTEAVVVDAPGTTPRTLTAKLPDHSYDVAVGTDAQQRKVLVVKARSGAFVLPADGSGAPTKLAGTTSKDQLFSMRDGRIAFVRPSGGRERVRTATAPGRTSRVLYTVPDEYDATELELGANGTVALHASRPRDVGIIDIVWLLRPGKATKRLTSQSTGGASENGMEGLVSSAAGRTFSISRWNIGGGHPNDVQRFSASTGKRLAVRKATDAQYFEAVVELALDRGGSVIEPVQTDGCSDALDPRAGLPTCPWLSLVP